MDVELRCNNGKCRKSLGGSETHACVTTCSHIFCVACADTAFSISLLCPSCQTSLTASNDIVLAELNPSEDYKSSVLAGLRPDIIADVCQRALSFWTYQVTQEIGYQEMLRKVHDNKYRLLEEQTTAALTNANGEVARLRERIKFIQDELEQEKRRGHELAERIADKNKQHQKLLYAHERQKRQMASVGTRHVYNAADEGEEDRSSYLPSFNKEQSFKQNAFSGGRQSKPQAKQVIFPVDDMDENWRANSVAGRYDIVPDIKKANSAASIKDSRSALANTVHSFQRPGKPGFTANKDMQHNSRSNRIAASTLSKGQKYQRFQSKKKWHSPHHA